MRVIRMHYGSSGPALWHECGSSSRLNGAERVLSSVGRAAPLQGVGREFEPLSTHQFAAARKSDEAVNI